MKDTRLSQDELALAVEFAYGGGAFRRVRELQARTLSDIVRRLWRGRSAH